MAFYSCKFWYIYRSKFLVKFVMLLIYTNLVILVFLVLKFKELLNVYHSMMQLNIITFSICHENIFFSSGYSIFSVLYFKGEITMNTVLPDLSWAEYLSLRHTYPGENGKNFKWMLPKIQCLLLLNILNSICLSHA